MLETTFQWLHFRQKLSIIEIIRAFRAFAQPTNVKPLVAILQGLFSKYNSFH